MTIIIQGMRIDTDCQYIKLTEAKYLNLWEEKGSTSIFHIEYPRGFLSENIIDRRIEILNSFELTQTDYIEVANPVCDLCGLEITKLVKNPYSISQFIVSDLDKFTMVYDDTHCEILIPKILSFNTKSYIQLLQKNPYIKVLDYSKLDTLYNIYGVLLRDNPIKFTTTNKFVFDRKGKYDKYIIQDIDYMNSFIDLVRNILIDNGFELVRIPIDENIATVDRVTYQFTDIGRQTSRKTEMNPMRFIVDKTSHVEFRMSTPNLNKYFNFRDRYQNLDLLSQLTQFYTEDKLGKSWISSVMWNPIDTSFVQDYAQDSQSNIAFEASFSADLNYSIMFDEAYITIQKEIISILDMNANDNITVITL